MTSALPTGENVHRNVQQFGLGPYDYSEGEDCEGESAPPDPMPFGAETLYASSEVPSDEDNPSARSDYYDHMVINIGQESHSDLPGVGKADQEMDDGLSALGNSWSGYVTEDTSGPNGFPTSDRSASEGVPMERRSWEKKMDEAMKIPDEESRKEAISALAKSIPGQKRQATNMELVGDLAKAVVKAHGRKDLTRRHVMAVLDEEKAPQFLASDVIRCLKLRHSVFMADSLTDFPVAPAPVAPKPRAAAIAPAPSPRVQIPEIRGSAVGASKIRDQIIALEITNSHRPEVASVLRRCAAAMSHMLIDLEKLEARHG